jgi:hypothetical protein
VIRATARAFLAFFALLSCGLALAAVGRTPGVPAVSVSGEGSYTIPLNLPPGRSGIQPELALVYSHRGGNGLLGMGWSIAGLSAITRCTATVAQDNWAGPITGTPSDELCLDGNKLRLLEDEAEDIYGTEIEAFSKIVATGTPPTKFVQYRRNGLIYTYGGTADSQIGFGGTTSIWALSEVRDRSGNYMTLTYHEDSTSYRPNQIIYAAHEQGTLATHAVVFHYESARPDSLRGYYAGRLTNQTQRMPQIEISYAGSAARTYDFEYETGTPTGRSRLTSITECGRSGGCYAPTTFQYDDGLAGWGTALSGPAISTMEHAIAGDFNGDGREDVAFFDVGLDAWQVAFAPASGGYPAATNTGKGKAAHYTQAVPIDLNADGLMDLLVPDGSNPNWYWLHKTGTSWAFEDTTRPATGAGDGNVRAVDVDGDGCQDLVYGSSATQLSWRKNNCNGTKTSLASSPAIVWTAPSGYSLAPQPFASLAQTYKQLQRAADFNGDGRGDLVVALTQETSGPPRVVGSAQWRLLPPGDAELRLLLVYCRSMHIKSSAEPMHSGRRLQRRVGMGVDTIFL